MTTTTTITTTTTTITTTTSTTTAWADEVVASYGPLCLWFLFIGCVVPCIHTHFTPANPITWIPPLAVRGLSADQILTMRRQTLFLWSAYFASIEKIALTVIEIVKDRIFRQTTHQKHHWNMHPGSYFRWELIPQFHSSTSRIVNVCKWWRMIAINSTGRENFAWASGNFESGHALLIGWMG